MTAAVAGLLGLAVEVAEADPLQGADGKPRDLIATHHHERAQHREQHKCERRCTSGLSPDVPRNHAGLNHDQRELADLRQIDGRQ